MKVCSVCQRCYDDAVLSCSENSHDVLSEGRAGSCEEIVNYRLERRLDATPSVETYLAANTILNKSYLIRIHAPELFDEKSKKAFLSEAQRLASMFHENVARTFESGALADGALYAVTEYFESQETLRDVLANSLTEVGAVSIARQAAEGLEAIHGAGALHRNLRPENILVTREAANKLTVKLRNPDFGGIHQKQVNRHNDLYLADLRYFAPEQCEAKDADAQTDVYALGVVLYEMLAGRVPFDAPYGDALAAKHLKETPPEVKIKSFDIRMLLTHTLTDALHKQTRTRLKTANAFARRLRHIEQLATHSSTPPPAVAYPAPMSKTAFAPPPAKPAQPVEIQTIIETVTPVEIQIPVETVTPVEIQTPIESAPPVEIQTSIETQLKVETAPPVVENPPVEVQALFETPSISEESAAMEMATAKALAAFGMPIIIKTLPVAATPAAAIAPPIMVEVEPAEVVENLPVAEAQAVTDEFLEDETIDSPVADYTTTKLPPIDSIVEFSTIEREVETVAAAAAEEKAENHLIHQASEPVLLEWEQPDDVPTTTQTLSLSRKKKADAEFAVESVAAEPEDAETLETDEVEYVSESYKTRRDYAKVKPVFSYEDAAPGGTWNLPEKRTIIAGAAILGLLVVAVGGTFLNRRLQALPLDNQTSAKSEPNPKTLPKVAEPEKIAPVEPQNVTVNNPAPVVETSDPVELPAYQPRETEEKPFGTVSPVRVKKPATVKKPVETRENPAPVKAAEETVLDKRGNAKPSADKKAAVQNKPAAPGKTDYFTRPRIVKTPKQ